MSTDKKLRFISVWMLSAAALLNIYLAGQRWLHGEYLGLLWNSVIATLLTFYAIKERPTSFLLMLLGRIIWRISKLTGIKLGRFSPTVIGWILEVPLKPVKRS